MQKKNGWNECVNIFNWYGNYMRRILKNSFSTVNTELIMRIFIFLYFYVIAFNLRFTILMPYPFMIWQHTQKPRHFMNWRLTIHIIWKVPAFRHHGLVLWLVSNMESEFFMFLMYIYICTMPYLSILFYPFYLDGACYSISSIQIT